MTVTSPTTPPLHCVPLSPGRGWRRSTPHTPARRGRSASPPAARRSAPRPRSRGARSARTRSRSSAPWRSRRPAPSPPSRPRSRGASPPCAARPSRAERSGRAGRPGRSGWWLPGGGTERGRYGGGAYWGGVILRWGDTEVGWYWGGVILRWGAVLMAILQTLQIGHFVKPKVIRGPFHLFSSIRRQQWKWKTWPHSN